MARRGDEAQAEALQVVERIVQRMDFQLAAVAGAGIDLADRQAAAEPALRRAVKLARRVRSDGSVTGERRPWRASSAWRRTRRASPRLRRRPGQQRPASRAAGWLLHVPSQIVPRIGAVERLVAEREVGDDVALDRRFQQRPLEPGRIAQMAAVDASRRRRSAATPAHRRGTPRPAQCLRRPRWLDRDAQRRRAAAGPASARSATGSARSP